MQLKALAQLCGQIVKLVNRMILILVQNRQEDILLVQHGLASCWNGLSCNMKLLLKTFSRKID